MPTTSPRWALRWRTRMEQKIDYCISLIEAIVAKETAEMTKLDDVNAGISALNTSMDQLDADIAAAKDAFTKVKQNPADADAQAALDAALTGLAATKARADNDHSELGSTVTQALHSVGM